MDSGATIPSSAAWAGCIATFKAAGVSASKLAYLAGAGQSVSLNSVSSVITVQVQDSNGNPVTTGATVGLSTSSTGGKFYSDSGGNNQITSLTISSGQSSGNFYYKDTMTGTPTLTAASTGLTSATTQFTITSGSSLSASSPLQISNNVISIPQANSSTNGYLASSDWNTFSNKQNALGSSPIFNGLTISGNAALSTLNITSGLTLDGNAGSSGQVLTSNSSGNAPTWQTVSGGGLVTVTPADLSGSGPLPSGWTIGGSQVLGNISGNSASIMGTIAHSQISDWSSATSTFVTSGSTVIFNSMTVSGSLSLGGFLSVNGALSITGAVATIRGNSLDDGSGNATVTGYICNDEYWHSYTNQDGSDFTDALHYHYFKDINGNPQTTGYIKLYDLTEGQGYNFVCLFGELFGGDPILVCSQHLGVEKDFIATGMLKSLEGEVVLSAGRYAPNWGPASQNPFIQLADMTYQTAPSYTPSHYMLEIRKAVANGTGDWATDHSYGQIWGWGDLACGNLVCNGNVTMAGGITLNGTVQLISENTNEISVRDTGGNVHNGVLDSGRVFCDTIQSLSSQVAVNSDMLLKTTHLVNYNQDWVLDKYQGSGRFWWRYNYNPGDVSSYFDLMNLDNSGTLSVAGNLYVGGLKWYNDGGYMRTGSSLVTNGTMTVTSNGGTGTSSSLYFDSNRCITQGSSLLAFKTNIETLDNASWIYNLRPVTFDWKDPKDAQVFGRQIGLIAEEVMPNAPLLTFNDYQTGQLRGVLYEKLAVPMLAELKKLRADVDQLKAKLASA
jgi:hypothetical protein